MIECLPETVIPVDERVVRSLETSRAFHLAFDPDYIRNLASFHGGTPVKPYVADSIGMVRRIGWFVPLIDDRSTLPPPFQPGTYHYENDTRIDDRAIPAILSDEVCPFHFGERLIPFAALYTDDRPPTSLRLYTLDWLPGDSLCFDLSTRPQAIVYCNAQKAVDQALEWEDDRTGTFQFSYDFLIPVAKSFRDFATQLRHLPEHRDA